VNTWATVFLGIIAMATLLTAILQVVLLVAAAQLVRRLMKFVDDLDRQLQPIIGHVNSIASDASRVASLAAAQVERADQMLNHAVVRIEDLLSHMQTLVVSTLREGNALMIGVRAVMAAVRAFQGRKRRRAEDDETLFI
jgi:signal transduction histidine kinase